MLFQKYNFFKGSVKTLQDEQEKAAVPAGPSAPCSGVALRLGSPSLTVLSLAMIKAGDSLVF